MVSSVGDGRIRGSCRTLLVTVEISNALEKACVREWTVKGMKNDILIGRPRH